MGQLRNRIRVIVARVRAGEGAHVLADLAETTEHWLKSGTVPRPLRPPAERIGTAVGELGRAYRPPPSDMPPPEVEEATPRTARAHEAARSNGHTTAKASKRAKPGQPEPPKARASARRSATKKRAASTSAPAPEPKPQQRKTNGKGKSKRPSARRTSGDKTPKPT